MGKRSDGFFPRLNMKKMFSDFHLICFKNDSNKKITNLINLHKLLFYNSRVKIFKNDYARAKYDLRIECSFPEYEIMNPFEIV